MALDRRSAVFLDRDGVIVVPQFRDGRSFAPTSLDQFRLYDDAQSSTAALRDAGFLIVVVTNQPDVGAGKVERSVVEEMNRRIAAALPIDAIKVCWHTQQDNCSCRKPLPGMLIEAADELGIDLTSSIMIGDRASDVAAGQAVGCRTIFIDLGYTAEAAPRDADVTVTSLHQGTRWILDSLTRDRGAA